MSRISSQTGLNILRNLTWGTHFCVFYETKRDLLDVLVPYFKAGLDHQEFCFWVLAEDLKPDEAMQELSAEVSDFDRHFARGDIQLVSREQWFFENGHLDLHAVIDRFKERCRDALSRGYLGMRFEGSSAWLAMKDTGQFNEFESELDTLVSGQRMMVLCSFPLGESGAEQILSAARTHQFTLVRRQGAWEILDAPVREVKQAILTPREREVFVWLARGKSAEDVATILHISRRTVEAHAQSVIQKLGASNRTQAVAIALRDRLIDLDGQP